MAKIYHTGSLQGFSVLQQRGTLIWPHWLSGQASFFQPPITSAFLHGMCTDSRLIRDLKAATPVQKPPPTCWQSSRTPPSLPFLVLELFGLSQSEGRTFTNDKDLKTVPSGVKPMSTSVLSYRNIPLCDVHTLMASNEALLVGNVNRRFEGKSFMDLETKIHLTDRLDSWKGRFSGEKTHLYHGVLDLSFFLFLLHLS